jgi:hypothetical protein
MIVRTRPYHPSIQKQRKSDFKLSADNCQKQNRVVFCFAFPLGTIAVPAKSTAQFMSSRARCILALSQTFNLHLRLTARSQYGRNRLSRTDAIQRIKKEIGKLNQVQKRALQDAIHVGMPGDESRQYE